MNDEETLRELLRTLAAHAPPARALVDAPFVEIQGLTPQQIVLDTTIESRSTSLRLRPAPPGTPLVPRSVEVWDVPLRATPEVPAFATVESDIRGCLACQDGAAVCRCVHQGTAWPSCSDCRGDGITTCEACLGSMVVEESLVITATQRVHTVVRVLERPSDSALPTDLFLALQEPARDGALVHRQVEPRIQALRRRGDGYRTSSAQDPLAIVVAQMLGDAEPPRPRERLVEQRLEVRDLAMFRAVTRSGVTFFARRDSMSLVVDRTAPRGPLTALGRTLRRVFGR